MRRLLNRGMCFGVVKLLLLNVVLSSGIVDAMAAEKSARDVVQGAHTSGSEANDRLQLPTDARIDSTMAALGLPMTKESRRSLVQGFPVSDNALGDMNQDSIVNIWDLLRIRNIAIGLGDPPSAYEEVEGDLTQDGQVTQNDVTHLAHAIIGTAGLPHVIGSDGGVVAGGEITVTIPAGAIDTPIVASVRSVNIEEFADQYQIDIEASSEEEAWIASAFVFEPVGYDFKAPLQFQVEPFDMPPCSLRQYNGLAAVTGDQDGDGHPDVFPIVDLFVNEDSTGLYMPSTITPTVDSVATQSSRTGYRSPSGLTTIARPGAVVTVYGSGFFPFESWALFAGDADTAFAKLSIDPTGDSLLMLTPYLPEGIYQVRILQPADGSVSNSFTVEVQDNLTVAGNVDSIITAYFDERVLHLQENLTVIDNDTSLGSAERAYMLDVTNSSVQALGELRDSVFSADSATVQLVASIIEEAFPNGIAANLLSKGQHTDRDCPEDCLWGPLKALLGCLVSLLFPPAAASTCAVLASGALFDHFLHCLDCWPDCPFGYETVVVDPEGQVHPEGYVCPNCRKAQICLKVPIGTPGYGPPSHHFKSSGARSGRSNCECEEPLSDGMQFPVHPLSGAIVSPVNYRLPFRMVTKVGGDGRFTMPCLPYHQQVTLQMYDPATGLYDDTVATFTAPGYGQRVPLDFPVFFLPDSSQIRLPIPPCETAWDTVRSGQPRFEYILGVTSDMIGDTASLYFTSEENLTVWLQDTNDDFLIQESSVNCISDHEFVLTDQGSYTITVTYGSMGGDGSFLLGLTGGDCPQFGYLCGQVPYDTLYYVNSPYQLTHQTHFTADTTWFEPNVVLEILPGGGLGQGNLIPTDSSSLPLIVRPVDSIHTAPSNRVLPGLSNRTSANAAMEEVNR